jgi:ribose transport system substrate-binding protein
MTDRYRLEAHDEPLDEREISRMVGSLSRRGMLGLTGLAGLAAAVACTDKKEAKADATTAAATGAAAGAGAKKFRAAYSDIGPGSGSTWEARGIETAKLYGGLLGAEVVVFDSGFKAEKQLEQLEQIAGQDFDFVAIHAGAINAFVDPVKKILAKGTPVIQMDTKIADDTDALGVTTFIEPNNIYMGETMANTLFTAIGGKGEVIHTQGNLTHTGAQLRGEGFKNAAKKWPDIKVVDESSGMWSAEETSKLWENLLVKFPDVKGGYFHNDDMALAAAASAKGKGKDVKMVGIDGMEPACEAVAKGDLLATVINPTGRIHGTAMWVGYLLASKKIKEVPKYIRADGGVVEKETAAGFKWLGEQFQL